jgi:hypothetical protein
MVSGNSSAHREGNTHTPASIGVPLPKYGILRGGIPAAVQFGKGPLLVAMREYFLGRAQSAICYFLR